MLTDLSKLIAGFGKPTKSSSYSAASAIGKGIASGNKIENIPPELGAYSDFLKSTENVKWIKWQVSGAPFIDISENCPFCTAPTAKTKDTIQLVGKEFDAKTVERLSAIIDIPNELSSYFTKDTNIKLKQITTNKATISEEEKTYLGLIRQQAETLKNKVFALQNMNFFNLKDEKKTIYLIHTLKIDVSLLPQQASEATLATISTLNTKLDEVAAKAGELQGKIRTHQTRIATTIETNTSSINEFLRDAGYKYKVKIEEDPASSTYKLKLDHQDLDGSISDGKQPLSYGERNAFALVLFMHETLSTNPDLIILDDPISSFDDTKKFSISRRLFSSGSSLKDKTVLLLTQDFEPIIDAIYVKRDIFSSVNASHIANENGTLVETPITKDDILSFPQLCKKVVDSDIDHIIKAIYLRRYFEILDNKADEYQMLSSLFHGKDVPNRRLPRQEDIDLNQAEIDIAAAQIRILHPEFNYHTCLLTIKSKVELIKLYKENSSNYIKLQIFRMLNLPAVLNVTFMKHINETFHIENEYVMQIDPKKYQIIPGFVIEACDAEIKAYEEVIAE